MRLRLVHGGELATALTATLDGGDPVAPVPEARLLGALRADLPVTEADAAAVVTTSGSTGDPKAVVLTRAALRFAVTATHERLGGPGDWVCALPTQHVAGLMTVARAVVAGTEVRFARGDLADLPPAVDRSYVSLVAAQLDRALGEPETTARLRDYAAVLLGGGALPASLRERSGAAGVRVVATYGMSETCGGCVYDGVPLDGVRVELEAGRISLGGPMAFAGYRLRPELTAAVLDGDLVHTQDRGRWAEGRLQVLGRVDDVVISGGENVDLAAAQRAADAAFGAAGVVLLAVPDERWGTRVVAVTTGAFTLAEVRGKLEPLLGRAATPKELRRVGELAYTSIGKIDRTALLRSWAGKGEYGDAG
ncbi:MAG TPA: AMP-binding protein [Propionicimonas sp.]|jgi:O-succinylbenzoic acid--CoA ligase|uniref:AMP-binding protein n=1 Tax=Propionicimonas sp. TaxID=1955623 RepID=UPI002F3FCEBC